MTKQSVVPLWLKLSFTLLATVVVTVYWRDKGPSNLLWFSDIALILLVPALWLQSRLLNSTMAVAVLFLEIGWLIDFISGSNLLQVTDYMFDVDHELHLRILSGLFHITMPPVIIFLLLRLGYDPRALPLQSLLAAVVLPVTYLVSDPDDNINMVFGIPEPQQFMHPWLYLLLLLGAFIALVYIPSHHIFKRLFNSANKSTA
ncbi:membrane-associated protein [Aliidiomarina minuta]|uniref:Membrane-associated protein n=1 Tax=Aliidiomarina minuta TaxID=880057 RepID=A0A432W5Q2_9GAMM|nr:membrane-associated protein [Aliidiomarina minuta]RUO25316.1 membrane-associated protein [Aliidiomarina minuta]